MTWPEAVDEALCVGWIDGLRQGVDNQSYRIRFTPRKPVSNWSTVNVRRVEELTRQGRMQPAGLKAFEQRSEAKTGIYSYENRHAAVLDAAAEKKFRSNSKAWKFFQSQPPWYRKTATWWIVSARKVETRQRRLETLIESAAEQAPIKPLLRPVKSK
jgi:uncharacterized protein YdeI (YjbR/CyaY-like superfamily)